MSLAGGADVGRGGSSSARGNPAAGGVDTSPGGSNGGSTSAGIGRAGNGGTVGELPGTYPIDPAALVGCRAPDASGCGRCCLGETDSGNCVVRSGESNWSLYPSVDPWYNITSWQDGACPSDCAPCAQCDEFD